MKEIEMPIKNDDRNDRYTPVKKFIFPAGECGGEIRINIPVFASK